MPSEQSSSAHGQQQQQQGQQKSMRQAAAAAAHDFDGEGSDVEGGPVTSFQSHFAEGDILAKQGDYKKAVEAYSKALNQRPTDKSCLVARAKCYLQLGNPDAALQDAETALREDKEFVKAVFQKAEALYAKGDFEMALVFFHRGNRLRPELDDFRLGIQKAREAIGNSIGNPKDYKFKALPNFTFDGMKQGGGPNGASPNARQKQNSQGSRSAKGMRAGGETHGVTVNLMNNSRRTYNRQDADASSPQPSQTDSQRNSELKQLLGELYSDMEYLSQFSNDTDFQRNPNNEILYLVSSGLEYLETRTDFWRQQKPIYARRKEAAVIQAKMRNARERQEKRKSTIVENKNLQPVNNAPLPLTPLVCTTPKKKTIHQSPDSSKTPEKTRGDTHASTTQPVGSSIEAEDNNGSPNDQHSESETTPTKRNTAGAIGAIQQTTPDSDTARDVLEAIASAARAEDHLHTCSLGEHYLDRFRAESSVETVCHVLTLTGGALFELGEANRASTLLSEAVALAQAPARSGNDVSVAQQSSALGLLGRVHAKMRRYNEAADSWRRKLAVDTSLSAVERAWLHHDIARCYVELHDHTQAIDMTKRACEFAAEAAEPRWLLNTSLLAAQLASEEGDKKTAVSWYEKAQKYALDLGEPETTLSIKAEIENISTLIPATATSAVAAV